MARTMSVEQTGSLAQQAQPATGLPGDVAARLQRNPVSPEACEASDSLPPFPPMAPMHDATGFARHGRDFMRDA